MYLVQRDSNRRGDDGLSGLEAATCRLPDGRSAAFEHGGQRRGYDRTLSGHTRPVTSHLVGKALDVAWELRANAVCGMGGCSCAARAARRE